ncbi:MAG TPA: response regulator transcription factor [Thermoanaerobaculia bacterium]|jgi:DNA-binding NarL/FixJ family response regulator
MSDTVLPAVRVLVTGEYFLIRTALARLIAGERGMELAAECANRIECVTEAMREAPDAMVIDIDHCESLALVRHVRPVPVLVLTAHEDSPALAVALGQGALGVVLKSRPAEVLMRAIRAVAAGEAWIEPSVLARMAGVVPRPASPEASRLTRRECEIVELVGLGLKNKIIAQRLFITETTVRHHLTSIFSKLSVTSRLELMRYTYRGKLAGTFVPDARD